MRLTASLEEARRRAASRHERLTASEFEALHQQDGMQPALADMTIDVTSLDPTQEIRAIEVAWAEKVGW